MSQSEPLRYQWRCQLCDGVFPTQLIAEKHFEKDHPKELARGRLTRLELSVTDETDLDAQLKVREAIAAFTRKFLVDESDTQPLYSIEETLGDTLVHEMYQRVMDCGYAECSHEGVTPEHVDKALTTLRKGKKKPDG